MDEILSAWDVKTLATDINQIDRWQRFSDNRRMRQWVATMCAAAGLTAVILAQAAEPIRCMQDSPERRGGTGCSIVADTLLRDLPAQPLYWHIDKFPALRAAQAAAGAASVAIEAHGSAWLMKVEPQSSDHHGGQHAAAVGPLPIPSTASLMMQIMSAHFLPGQVSEPHTHPGPEAWFVIEGEQCLETPTGTIRAKAGETAIIDAGPAMRLVGTGTGPRRALVLVLHGAAQPPTTITRGVTLASCR